MKHTVVISDVHLAEAVPGDGLWMRYRQRRFFPDEEFSQLFDRMRMESRGGALSLVFNGDLFDFDAPPVVQGEIRFEDPPRSEAVAVEALTRILDDHVQFIDAVARVLADGHEVVFVSGNHDAQLAWPDVRALLTARLLESAASQGCEASSEALVSRLVFRTWFHRTEDGIHIEHGNQYDKYCSFRYPMEPYTADGHDVQPTMGSLSFRHLVSRMGYFNPHVDSSFMLSAPQYVAHWAGYYLFSKHSLAVAWALGALRITRKLFQQRQPKDDTRAERNVETCVLETGADRNAIARHVALFAAPSDDEPHAVLRELWLDRTMLGTLGILAVGIGAIRSPMFALKLAAIASGAIAAYELAVPKPPLSDVYRRAAGCQRRIGKIYGARAVVFGHTHQPYGRWEEGVFYGNSGTWSAAYKDIECTRPVEEGRPVIWLRADDSGGLSGGLYRWCRGLLSDYGAIEDESISVSASLLPQPA